MDPAVAKLHETIERLQRELAETTQEKIQAAEYGLAVLNEKQHLQAHVETIESQFEAARNELELTRTALEKYNRIVKRQTQVGAEEDEQRAIETAQRESDYAQQILDLEFELRGMKHQLEEVRSENANFSAQNNELRETVDRFERERVAMKGELRDVRGRETRLASEYSELEEENIQLQKQIAHLRSSQLELEATRHEMARLENELVTLTGQLEETVRLKSIIERQLEETLVSLQSEREHKYALKRELDTARIANAMPSASFMNTSLNASVSMSMMNAAALFNVPTSNGRLNDSASSYKLDESTSASALASSGRTEDTSAKPQPAELASQETVSRSEPTTDEVERSYFGHVTESEPANLNPEAEVEPEADAESPDGDDSSEVGNDEALAGANANQESAGTQNSLFAEVHRSELRRVQEVLSAAEAEKQDLLGRLADRDRQLDNAKREALGKQQQLERLQVYCNAISSLNEMAAVQDGETITQQSALVPSASSVSLLTHSASACSLAVVSAAHETSAPDAEKMEPVGSAEPSGLAEQQKDRRESANDSKDRIIRQYEVRYAAALKQIASLTFELRRVEDRLAVERSGKSESQLRDELVELRAQLAAIERDAKEREGLLRQRTDRAVALRRSTVHYSKHYFDLLFDLASIASPLRNDALETIRSERERHERSALLAADLGESEACTNAEQNDEAIRTLESDLLGSLRRRIDVVATEQPAGSAEREDRPVAGSAANTEAELREQVARMREALVAKREQVLTLRNLLKANKTAAELGVATLREKYETERSAVSDTMRRLRDELRTLKEDAAQFASLRCMFAQRCDEYTAQLDEARTLLRAADEERLTLSGSLKLALSQKMALAQRLDALERERERAKARRAAQRHTPVESSPAHGRGGRFVTGKSVAVYATQNTGNLPPQRYGQLPHNHAFNHAAQPTSYVSSATSFNPLASPFNPSDSQSHFAACQPGGYAQPAFEAHLQHYQSNAAQDMDPGQRSLDTAAYLQLIQQALTAGAGGQQQQQPPHLQRAYNNAAQTLSNAIENQISSVLASSGSTVHQHQHQVVAPTAVYPNSATPFGGAVPPSPSRFATSPSSVAPNSSSGSPSPFAVHNAGKLVNGADRGFSSRQ